MLLIHGAAATQITLAAGSYRELLIEALVLLGLGSLCAGIALWRARGWRRWIALPAVLLALPFALDALRRL